MANADGSYYRPLTTGRWDDGRYVRRWQPTEHTAGAWRIDEQHMAPVAGLLVHAIDGALASRPRPGQPQISRVSFDILGVIGRTDFEVVVDTLRPGRTVELVEATLTISGRAAVRARAWLLSAHDTAAVAGGWPEPMAGPEAAGPALPFTASPAASVWQGGYINSLQVAALPGHRPGRGRAWLHTDLPLVHGEPASALARYVGLVDTANGIAVRVPPSSWLFPNVDLTVHLYREPVGAWVGLDTTVTFGPTGVGLTSTALHDVTGPVGRAEQILTIRRLTG